MQNLGERPALSEEGTILPGNPLQCWKEQEKEQGKIGKSALLKEIKVTVCLEIAKLKRLQRVHKEIRDVLTEDKSVRAHKFRELGVVPKGDATGGCWRRKSGISA